MQKRKQPPQSRSHSTQAAPSPAQPFNASSPLTCTAMQKRKQHPHLRSYSTQAAPSPAQPCKNAKNCNLTCQSCKKSGNCTLTCAAMHKCLEL
eukprot:scaffold122133_cov15-Tisochrysis_lutea.AAC.2